MKGQIKVGTYTGTGAAINVEIGFVPDFVLISQVTEGDLVSIWYNGMAAGTSVDIAAAAALNAANGVTAYAGTRGDDSAGFTAGTDISTDAKVYRYIAMANQ